jgi:hypothetical protein
MYIVLIMVRLAAVLGQDLAMTDGVAMTMKERSTVNGFPSITLMLMEFGWNADIPVL